MIQDTLNSKGYQTQKQWTKEIFTKLGVFVDLVTFHFSLFTLESFPLLAQTESE